MEQIPVVREMILMQRNYIHAHMTIIDNNIQNLFTEMGKSLDPMRVQRLADHARRLVKKRVWFEITDTTLQDYADCLSDIEFSVQNLVIAQMMNGLFAAAMQHHANNM